jgi:hypothetical protein
MLDVLGEPVSYTPKGGSLETITAVFEYEYVDPDGKGFASLYPVASCKSSDGTFQEGDVFVVDSTTYGVIAVEPDSDGMTKCILGKRSG